jgi:ribosomal protein S18 acetylase RimI-like enzyme
MTEHLSVTAAAGTAPGVAPATGATIAVRAARRDDAAAVAGLLRRAYAEYAETFPWPDLWQEYVADITDVHGRWDRTRVLVAEHSDDGGAGEIVGSVDYYPPFSGGYRLSDEAQHWFAPDQIRRMDLPPAWASVRCMAVRPDRRGLGIGRALLARVVATAADDGASHVVLHSLPIMVAAKSLYESAGFERRPDRDLQLLADRPDELLGYLLPLGATAFADAGTDHDHVS